MKTALKIIGGILALLVTAGLVFYIGWLRAPDQSVGEAMQGAPCSLPLASEMQGETLAFHAAGTGYFTLSEGADQPLWWYAYE